MEQADGNLCKACPHSLLTPSLPHSPLPCLACQSQPSIRPKGRGSLGSVLLVGGATRMPSVPRFIRHMTGLEPLRGPAALDPDEAVALGAAVQAGMLNGDLPDMMIMDQFQVRQGRGRTGGRAGPGRGSVAA